jgi:hypothetical protein
VRNANPQTRAAQAASMPFYEQSEEIDPTLTNLRDAYIADVQGLNALVQEAVSLGYDPRTIDYQDPQSIEVNKRYREMLEPIKQKEMQLRYAKPVTTKMRQSGELYDPFITEVSNLSGFGGAENITKAYNASLSSMGYDQAGIAAAEAARQQAIEGINAVYAPYREQFKGNPVMSQALETKYMTDMNSLEQALPKGAKPQRDELAMYYQKKQIDKDFKAVEEVNDFDSKMQISVAPTNFTVKTASGTARPVLGLPLAGLGVVIAPKKSSVKTSGGKTEQATKQEFDRIAVLPMNKNGNAIFEPTATDEVVGFGVFAVGKADVGTGTKKRTVDVYDSYDIVSSVANKNYKAVSDDRRNKLQSEAARLNEEYFGKKPAAQPATKPARTQGTSTTDVSSIFGRP